MKLTEIDSSTNLETSDNRPDLQKKKKQFPDIISKKEETEVFEKTALISTFSEPIATNKKVKIPSLGEIFTIMHSSRSLIMHQLGLKIYQGSMRKLSAHTLFKRGAMLDEEIG